MTVRLGKGEDIYELLKVYSLNGLLSDALYNSVESIETAINTGLPHGASGADVWIPARHAEFGGTSSPHRVSGADIWIPAHWAEFGYSASSHAASGADVHIQTPDVAGSAATPHAISGADVLTHIGIWPATFPATPILDNFNRADGPMGSDWAIYPSDYWLKIDSNQVVSGRGPGLGGEMYYTHAFGPDAEVYITCVSIDDGYTSFINLGDDPLTGNLGVGYQVNYTRNDAGDDTIELYDGYAFALGGTALLGSAIVNYSPGDAIGLRAVGASVKAYYKPAGGAWGEVISANVSAMAYTRGNGMAVIDLTLGVLDDFGGGPLVFDSNKAPTVYASITPLSVNTTLDSSMHVVFVSSGATITLPTVSTYTAIEYIIVNVDASAVTVNPSGGDTISGNASVTLNQWESVTIVSGAYAGQSWVITSRGTA